MFLSLDLAYTMVTCAVEISQASFWQARESIWLPFIERELGANEHSILVGFPIHLHA